MPHPRPPGPALIALLLLGCGPAPGTATEGASATSTGSEVSATDAEMTGSTGKATTQAPTESQSSSIGPGTTTSPTDPDENSVTSDTTCGFLCGDTDGQCQMVPGLDGELRCQSCDLWLQDCADGQKCTPWASDGSNSWNDTKCVEVAPNPHKPGEPCKAEGSGVSGIDDCELGAMCWDLDPDTLIGTCIGLCDGSPRAPTCAEPKTFCAVSGEGVLILCLPTCDPLASDCPEGQVCVHDGQDQFACATGFPGAVGAPCEFINTCDPGLACVASSLVPDCDPAATGCCSPYCSLSAPVCPDQNQTCTPWFEPDQAPEDYKDVGFCGLPQ